MTYCMTCGTEITDNMAFCPNCGAAASAASAETTAAQSQQPPVGSTQQTPQTPTSQPASTQTTSSQTQNTNQQVPVDLNQAVYTKDHTAEYSPADISDNKVFAIVAYLMGLLGVIVALLASHSSPFTMFHVRQSLKITVSLLLAGMITILLSWTIIVPLAYFIFAIVMSVVTIICAFNACKGKAKEAPIVSSFGFLK